MRIDCIFAIIKNSLLSVKFDSYETDELDRVFEEWTDIEFLYNFFNENINDLKSGFYGDITIEEAIDKTLEDAENLEKEILDLATRGQKDPLENLQTLFKPLNNEDYRIKDHQKSKAYGKKRKSWLRIYAIRIAKNTYVISGGAIKLTETMNGVKHLESELTKLEITKEYLIENGLFDKDDFEYLEIK